MQCAPVQQAHHFPLPITKYYIWDKHIVVHTTIFFYRGDHAHVAKSEKK